MKYIQCDGYVFQFTDKNYKKLCQEIKAGEYPDITEGFCIGKIHNFYDMIDDAAREADNALNKSTEKGSTS